MDLNVTKQNLEKRGYAVSVFETALEAAAYLNEQIDGATVGMGGSVTIDTMGLYESLEKHNRVFWHWRIKDGDSRAEILKNAQSADYYLASINGLSENGEIINIDGTGNRVSAIQFGHKKVFLLAGANKVSADYDAALFRARNVVAPLNAKRLERKTPCAVNADRCYDCNSPDRICRGLSVLWEKPGCCAYEIVLINESLGY